METFRCPTCLGVLHDAQVKRCAACGQNLRRKKPKVLGNEHRIGAVNLPIDRWMLARANESDAMTVPPPAEQGATPTTPVAAPPIAAPPMAAPEVARAPEPASPVETELEMTAVIVESVDAVRLTDEQPEIPGDDEGLLAPTVGALTLDQYTGAAKATVEAVPEPEPESDPAATAAPVKELDPDVRALVDELYEQARAELSGTDPASLEPADPDKRVND